MKIIKFLYRTHFLSYATYPRTSFFCSKRHFFSYSSLKLSFCQNQGKLTKIRYGIYLNTRSSMSCSATPAMAREKEMEQMDRILAAKEDDHGGVIVEMTNEPLAPSVFGSLLRASLSHWRQQGKKGVWIKFPIELATLIEPAVKEGFYYHHAEPKYLMLVSWLSGTANTIPANATHRVGIGAFVMNEKNEVLVVQEKSGRFRGTGVWKLPTGVVDEGEDICDAAVREVKEETGVDTKFVEILAFRQSHRSFFEKSDLFFVCMLQPLSFDIQKQDAEIEAAEWMPFEQYAAQPYVQGHDLFRYISDICSAKTEGRYTGFSSVPTVTSFSEKKTYLYMNSNDRTTGHDDP
ncbi:nudix hydrolase 2-like isoform X1 [Lycium barbarum]|uniref:nudix hydrolase 2-like isoform X1 n=1 Tax=Lycium barbarum TaxID=112863 RepID=UPI00293E2CF1|nr:nudix hydrolase 2-like isoform X1 [Lycium barbarum]